MKKQVLLGVLVVLLLPLITATPDLSLNNTTPQPLQNISINITEAENTCTIDVARPDGLTDTLNGTITGTLCEAWYIPSFLNGTYTVNATTNGTASDSETFSVSRSGLQLVVNSFTVNDSAYSYGSQHNFTWSVNDSTGTPISGFTHDRWDANPSGYFRTFGGTYPRTIEIRREILEVARNGSRTVRLTVELDSNNAYSTYRFLAGTHVNITVLGPDGQSTLPTGVSVTNGTFNAGSYLDDAFSVSGGVVSFNVSVPSPWERAIRNAYVDFEVPANVSLADIIVRIDAIRWVRGSSGSERLYVGDEYIAAADFPGTSSDSTWTTGELLGSWGRLPVYMPLLPSDQDGLLLEQPGPFSTGLLSDLSEVGSGYEVLYDVQDFFLNDTAVRLIADAYGYLVNVSDNITMNLGLSFAGENASIESFSINPSNVSYGVSNNISVQVNDSSGAALASLATTRSDSDSLCSLGELGNGASHIEIVRSIQNISTDGTVTARIKVDFDSEEYIGVGYFYPGTRVDLTIMGADGGPVPSGILLSNHSFNAGTYVSHTFENDSNTYDWSVGVDTAYEGGSRGSYVDIVIPPGRSLNDVVFSVNRIVYLHSTTAFYTYRISMGGASVSTDNLYDHDTDGTWDGYSQYTYGDTFSTLGALPVYLPLIPDNDGLFAAWMYPEYEDLDTNFVDSGNGLYETNFTWQSRIQDNVTFYVYADRLGLDSDDFFVSSEVLYEDPGYTLEVGNVSLSSDFHAPGLPVLVSVSVNDTSNGVSFLNNSDLNIDSYGDPWDNGAASFEIRREVLNVSPNGNIVARLIVEWDSNDNIGYGRMYPGSYVNLTILGADGSSPVPADILLRNGTVNPDNDVAQNLVNDSGVYSWDAYLVGTVDGAVRQAYLEFEIPPNRSLNDVVVIVEEIAYKYYETSNYDGDRIYIGNDYRGDGDLLGGDDGFTIYTTGDEFPPLGAFPLYLTLEPTDGAIILKAVSDSYGEPVNDTVSESAGAYAINHTWQSDTLEEFNVSACASKFGYSGGAWVCGPVAVVTSGQIGPPAIFAVRNDSITNYSVHITWSTDESANSSVEYGESAALGTLGNSSSSPALFHDLSVYGLSPSTQYFYNVTSCDADELCTSSGPYNFTTTTLDGVPYVESVTLVASDSPANTTNANLSATVSGAETYDTLIYDWRMNDSSIAIIYTPFDTNISSTVSGAVKDYSSTPWNATLGGGSSSYVPAWSLDSVRGGSYFFNVYDYSYDYIGLGSVDLRNLSEFTMSVWLKWDEIGTNKHSIVSNWLSSQNDEALILFRLAPSGNYLEGYVNCDGSGIGGSFPDITIDDNTSWHNLVVTYDGAGYLEAYLDGVKSTTSLSACGSLGPTLSSTPLEIGRSKHSIWDDGYRGYIDEFMLLNRTLSWEQINASYNSGVPRHDFMVSNETTTGNDYSVCVTPNDRTQDGSEVCSSTVTILEGNSGTVCVNETGVCWDTIQEAIENATSGQTVVITDNGTYNENLTIGKPLTLTSNGTGRPTIVADNATAIQENSVSNIEIRNLNINISGDADSISVIDITVTSVTLANMNIYANLSGSSTYIMNDDSSSGVSSTWSINNVNITTTDSHRGFYLTGNINPSFTNTRFEGAMDSYAIYSMQSGLEVQNVFMNMTGSGGGIQSRGATVRDSEIHTTSGRGIQFDRSDNLVENVSIYTTSGTGINIGQNVNIRNVTITDSYINSSSGIGIDTYAWNGPSFDITVIDTEVYGGSYDMSIDASGTSSAERNVTLINTTIQPGDVEHDAFDGTDTSHIWFYSYLDATVQDENNEVLYNAKVNVTDTYGSLIADTSTGSDGRIPQKSLLYKYQNRTADATTNTTYTNHTIWASQTGYVAASTTANMSTNQDITITLEKPAADAQYIEKEIGNVAVGPDGLIFINSTNNTVSIGTQSNMMQGSGQATLKVDGYIVASQGFVTGDAIFIGPYTEDTDIISGTVNLNIEGDSKYVKELKGWRAVAVESNLGIGTKEPNAKLDVAGRINSRGGFTQTSSKKYKTDIINVEGQEATTLKNAIKNTPVISYRYQWDTTPGKRLGIRAEQAPQIILAEDGESIDVMSYATLIHEGIQELATTRGVGPLTEEEQKYLELQSRLESLRQQLENRQNMTGASR